MGLISASARLEIAAAFCYTRRVNANPVVKRASLFRDKAVSPRFINNLIDVVLRRKLAAQGSFSRAVLLSLAA